MLEFLESQQLRGVGSDSERHVFSAIHFQARSSRVLILNRLAEHGK